jgi:hypothetical protein
MTTALVSFKQLGDIIMIEPVSRLLADRSGAERSGGPVHFFTKRDFAPILGLMPAVKARMWSPRPYRRILALHEGTKTTRRVASLVSLDKTLILLAAGSLRWEHRLAYSRILVRPAGRQYMARHFWEGAGGDPLRFTPPKLLDPPSEWKPEQLGLPRRYIVVHPTAAWKKKYWDAAKWAGVIEFLQSAGNLPVVLSAGGTSRERGHCEAILAACRRRPISAAGRTSIREYVWLIANAAGVVAIDGSACHLADAFGVPAVKLFGETSEIVWHYDRPDAWLVLSGPQPFAQRPPASEIPLERVIAAAEAMLKVAPAPVG